MNSEYLKQQTIRLEQEYEALSAKLYAELDAASLVTTAEKTANELLTLAAQSINPSLRHKANRLEAIDAALCAIRLDLYGVCADCEEPIEKIILDNDPAQPRCQQCQSHNKYHHQR
ncbi:conjugal transfer protein TraR [Photobacterium sp. CCB-ST2H9]|uniref:conjugal transfer protein TraR n=1 Tax=unclassified Photobacterium TaxID=2628852 RepID=UPI00200689CB|nr:conjugal transfer protein TraR [Photobacterium sp. CCB-ST2H9]UTM58227.1 conjugal transfer protein TraR [Photobacterium sp. CCB-ST2H9]